MNANEIAFGIEFETTLPNHDTTPIGPYHHGYQVAWLPEGWRAEHDSSIRPTTPDRKGCEFVSPKLRGAAGLAEIENAIDQINARGGKVNPTCGSHITIEWNGDAAILREINVKGAEARFQKTERGKFALAGTTTPAAAPENPAKPRGKKAKNGKTPGPNAVAELFRI